MKSVPLLRVLTLVLVVGSPASAQDVPLSRVPIPKPSPLQSSPGAMAPATLPPSVPAGTLLPAPLQADAPASEASSTAHPADRA